MSAETAPICCYPTTVVLVDDKKEYLDALQARLKKGGLDAVYKPFDNATQAYEYLEQTAHRPAFLDRCIKQGDDPSRGHRIIDINLFPMREQIYNPERFEQVSVLVIDHDMPGMKGLEICKKLSGTPIKKILLTGEAKNEQAIEAFNEGDIDFFIPKGADNFDERINTAIAELKDAFMRESTLPITNSLTCAPKGYKLSCLTEPAFIEMLEKFVKENAICEYYLSDDNGSYIFLDKAGKPSWLVLKDEDEMESDFFMVDDEDNPDTRYIAEKLKAKESIVHLFTQDEINKVSVDRWEERGLLAPAKVLKGKQETYYYAFINDPDTHDIERDKILSFQGYLEQLKASLSEK